MVAPFVVVEALLFLIVVLLEKLLDELLEGALVVFAILLVGAHICHGVETVYDRIDDCVKWLQVRHDRPPVPVEPKHAFVLALLHYISAGAVESFVNLLDTCPDCQKDPSHVRREHLCENRLLRIILKVLLDVLQDLSDDPAPFEESEEDELYRLLNVKHQEVHLLVIVFLHLRRGVAEATVALVPCLPQQVLLYEVPLLVDEHRDQGVVSLQRHAVHLHDHDQVTQNLARGRRILAEGLPFAVGEHLFKLLEDVVGECVQVLLQELAESQLILVNGGSSLVQRNC